MLKLITNFKNSLLKSPNFKNAYWSIIDVVVYPLILLLSTPYFLKELGTELYGVWMLVNSFIISIGVLNAGMGDATIKFISKYRALSDKEGIKNVFNATFSITLAVALFAALLIILSASTVINSNLFEIKQSYRAEAIIALKLAAGLFAIRLIEQILFSYFKAVERFDIFSIYSTINKSAALLLSIILVVAGFSLPAIFLAHIAIGLTSLVLEVILISKYLGVQAFIPTYHRTTVSEVFSFSAWAWLQTVVGIISAQLDRYIVAAAVSMTGLAYYSIGLLVANQIHTLFAAASSFLFPLIAKKVEQKSETRHLYFQMQFLIISLGLTLILSLSVIQDYIFVLWLGSENYSQSKEYITLFLCFEAILLTSIIPYYYLIGTGNIRLNTLLMTVSTAAATVAMLVLFDWKGEVGLVWGKILASAIVSPFLYGLLHRRIFDDYNFMNAIKLLLPSAAAIAFILLSSILLKILSVLSCILFIYLFLFKKHRENREALLILN